MSKMSWAEIARLADEGKLADSDLCQRWQKRHHYDPAKAAKAIVSDARKWWRLQCLGLILYFVVLFGSIGIISLWEPSLSRLVYGILVGVNALMLVINIALFFQQGEIASERKLYHYRDSKSSFIVSLVRLSRCSESDPYELLMRTSEGNWFYHQASELLVHRAAQIIELERKNEGVPHSLWASQKEELKGDLKYEYDLFIELGLIGDTGWGGYGLYYDRAREKLKGAG